MMKNKKLIPVLVILFATLMTAVIGEVLLDNFMERIVYEETVESAVYQLDPLMAVAIRNCDYDDGLLTPTGEDPQIQWSMSPDKALKDMVVRYKSPLSDDCVIEVYCDDGSGFSEENVYRVYSHAGDKETLVPMPRGNYYNLRLDINGEAELDQIYCDASTYVTRDIPGGFRPRRCIAVFLTLFCFAYVIYAYIRYENWRGAIQAYGSFLKTDVFWAFLVSLIAGSFLSIYYHIGAIWSVDDGIRYALHPNLPVILIVFMILYGSMYVVRKRDFALGDWLYKFRWVIGAVLLGVCVLLKLNISSLHEWANYLGGSENGVVLGMSRAIRSDEWAKSIGTTLALSYENYPTFSHIIRAAVTENTLVSGHLALDISAIYRPLTWGYLLFGSAAYGLAFNNSASVILLFLLAFDFFMIVSRNRKLSFAFSCALFFSPFVQWWYAVCVELFISGFALVIAGYHYLTTTSLRKKILSAITAMVFAGNFILILYPAWQVPVAYFLLACLIWIIIDNRKKIKLRWRVDLPIIGGVLVLMAVSALIMYTRSASAIHDMVNTVYPGKVRATDPVPLSVEIYTFQNALSQYTYLFVPGPNPCEAADFISFFPMGILICAFAMIRNKKADVFSIAMMALSVFLGAFAFLPVPDFLRKITMMSYSMSGRIYPWFGFVQVILFIRGVSLLKGGTKWYIGLLAAVLYTGIVIYILQTTSLLAGQILMLSCLGIAVFFILWTAFRAGKDEYNCRAFATVMMVFCLFTAGAVNPIQAGMDEIEKNETIVTIRDIAAKDPDGKWLVDQLGFPYGNAPLLGGAPTINCVNNYPNLELWYKLDPERDDEYAYNRYVSQIIANIVQDEETTLHVGSAADLMDLRVNVNDLAIMEVSYVLTNRPLEEFSTDRVEFTRIASVSMFLIYHVEYMNAE